MFTKFSGALVVAVLAVLLMAGSVYAKDRVELPVAESSEGWETLSLKYYDVRDPDVSKPSETVVSSGSYSVVRDGNDSDVFRGWAVTVYTSTFQVGFTFGFNTSHWENDNWSIVEVTEDPGCAQLWFGNKLRMVAGAVMIQQRIACTDGTTYYMVENKYDQGNDDGDIWNQLAEIRDLNQPTVSK